MCLRTSAKEDIGSYGEVEANFVNDYRDSFFGIHRDFIDREQLFDIGLKLCEIIHPKYGVFYEIPFIVNEDHQLGWWFREAYSFAQENSDVLESRSDLTDFK